MQWRNRFKFQNNLKNDKIIQHHITHAPNFKFDHAPFVVYDVTDQFSDTIILQVVIVFDFIDTDHVFVRLKGDQHAISLYKSNATIKPVRKIKLMTDSIIFPIRENNIIFPTCVFEKNFATMEGGIHELPEIRSPQDKIPEQSLWSYGATYSMNFNVCQIAQTHFFAISVKNQTQIRLVHGNETLEKIISQGGITVSVCDDCSYQSSAITHVSPHTAHITFKKITNI